MINNEFPFGSLFEQVFGRDAISQLAQPTRTGEETCNYNGTQYFSVAKEDSVCYYVELPGCAREAISVCNTEQGGVTVEAKRNITGKERTFKAVLNPGSRYDANLVKCSYRDGLLCVCFPVKEAAKPHKIEII